MDYRHQLSKITDTEAYLSQHKLETIFQCTYNVQAIKFLLETETTCTIVLDGKAKASWGKSLVDKYTVTLRNSRHFYSFDFFNSIHDTEKNIKATFKFYSVLACLSSHVSESFDDFCAEYGYEFKNETEYIKAKSAHLACLDQAKNLRKLFTAEQLEQLSDIN